MTFGKIDVFDKNLVEKYGVVMDTGAPTTTVPLQKYNEIVNALKNVCKENMFTCNLFENINELCFIISTTDTSQSIPQYVDSIFPDFAIQFGAGTISMKATEYMMQDMGELAGRFCLRIEKHSLNSSPYILGINWFKNKEVTFNLDKNTVSIMPNADCTF